MSVLVFQCSCFQGQNFRERHLKCLIPHREVKICHCCRKWAAKDTKAERQKLFKSIRGRLLVQNWHFQCEMKLFYSLCLISVYLFAPEQTGKLDIKMSQMWLVDLCVQVFPRQQDEYSQICHCLPPSAFNHLFSEGKQCEASSFKINLLVIWETGTKCDNASLASSIFQSMCLFGFCSTTHFQQSLCCHGLAEHQTMETVIRGPQRSDRFQREPTILISDKSKEWHWLGLCSQCLKGAFVWRDEQLMDISLKEVGAGWIQHAGRFYQFDCKLRRCFLKSDIIAVG